MSSLGDGLAGNGDARPAVPSVMLLVGAILALTAVRLVGQHFSVVDIDVDEAQYWEWSRALAFGYFSKPPLIAWLGAASDLVCGDGIACIRAPAPLFYAATSLLVYATAREVYGGTAAFWAGLAVATAPGVSFSARIMSTDVPLLFFWALALVAYVKLMGRGGWTWAVVLATAFGLGLLTKYAMAYFVLGVLVAAAVSNEARALLASPRLWLGLAAGAAMLAPNIFWNVDHGFVTAGATAGYVGRSGPGIHFFKAIEFLAAQLALAGPIVFGTLVILFVRFGARDLSGDDRVMLAFALPPLLLVTVGALYSGRANANWAAAALISAMVVTSAFLVRGRWWRVLTASVAIGMAVQAMLLLADAFADRVTIPAFAQDVDLYQPALGWRQLGDKVGELAEGSGAASIAAEGRGEVSTLIYYRRFDRRPIFVWLGNDRPTNHFELTRPLNAAAPEPILFLSRCQAADRLRRDFAAVTDLGPVTTATGPNSLRSYRAFLLGGRRDGIGPLAPCG
ncbi:MAG: glycosyltransferase family 39 protein [Bauldia sp.]